MNNELFEYLVADISRYKRIEGITPDSSFSARLRLLFFSYGLHAIMVYRFGRSIRTSEVLNIVFPIKNLLLFVYHFCHFIIIVFYGINISLKADIGKGFFIGHFGNIFIGNCKIGENSSVNQQAQIGKKNSVDNNDKRILIGNNVWIGAQAKIEDGITVGNNATISGGSIVTSNVMENSLVMGNPARVVASRYDNSSLL
jgi:serine O-acetyltransferase